MATQRWLVTGASGNLGGHLVRRLAGRADGTAVLALAGQGAVVSAGAQIVRLDLRDLDALEEAVKHFRPTHILHVGALTSVAEAYARPEDARRINTLATLRLAELAGGLKARFVFTSTDMVFDGEAAPYAESAPPSPVSGRHSVGTQ